jgi:RimJ/RimL family protein N-acetyltransferase
VSARLPPSFDTGTWGLRQVGKGDQDFYIALHQNEAVMRHIAMPMSEAEAAASFGRWLCAQQSESGDRLWVVESRAGSLGILSLLVRQDQAEFGLMLGHAPHAARLPVDVVKALTDLVFAHTGLRCLKGRHRRENRAAGRVMALVGGYSRKVINGNVWWEAQKEAWTASEEICDLTASVKGN